MASVADASVAISLPTGAGSTAARVPVQLDRPHPAGHPPRTGRTQPRRRSHRRNSRPMGAQPSPRPERQPAGQPRASPTGNSWSPAWNSSRKPAEHLVDLAAAAHLHQQALTLLSAAPHTAERDREQSIVLNRLGETLRLLGRHTDAADRHREALSLAEHLQPADPVLVASALNGLGIVFTDTRQYANAACTLPPRTDPRRGRPRPRRPASRRPAPQPGRARPRPASLHRRRAQGTPGPPPPRLGDGPIHRHRGRPRRPRRPAARPRPRCRS